MATADETIRRCPRCERPLDPAAFATGEPFSCPGCGARMKRNPRAEDGSPKVEPSPQEPVVEDGVLAWLEDLLIKMIVGVFRFIFVKLPSEFYRALVLWFPTLVRLLKVASLLIVWLTVTFGPIAVALRSDDLGPTRPLDLISAPEAATSHSELWTWCAVAYTAVALCGSVWGAMYVRRLRKQARASHAAR